MPEPASLAVFVPQTRLPSPVELERVKRRLVRDERCRRIVESTRDLEAIRELLCGEKPEVTGLTHAKVYAKLLSDWLDGNTPTERLVAARSPIISFPLLLLVQFIQFLDYLDITNSTYEDFIRQVRSIQGYCAGLAAAVSIARGKDIERVIEDVCVALHLTFAIGLFAELGDDPRYEGVTSLTVHLQHESQGDELVKKFPNTHLAAVNDTLSVNIVGSSDSLRKLQEHASKLGLQVRPGDIRGRVHHPENEALAEELIAISKRHNQLALPDASELQISFRSNKDGSTITEGSLSEELIRTILASHCNWHSVIDAIADDLTDDSRISHRILSFGLGDCLTMSPFHRRNLQCTKIDVQRYLDEHDPIQLPDQHTSDHSIAIVGISCRFPGADDFDEFWNVISQGQDMHQELSADRFDLPGSFRAKQSENFMQRRHFWGNFLRDVKSADREFLGYSTKELLHLDPQQRLLIELAHEALEAGGLYDRKGPTIGSNVGCFIGASYIDYTDNTSSHAADVYTSTGTLRAFLGGRLSHRYGWHGPCEVVDTACSSSLVAINRACKALLYGECDVAVTGGVNIITSMNNYLDLARTGFLSPTGQCKPFDKSADGYCRSEGGGLVVLKPYAAAVADGNKIYGLVRGTAVNHGSACNSITAPDPEHQASLYRRVIGDAGVAPEDVTYVEAHGTGTQVGDLVEMSSIRSVLASPDRPTALSVGSIKANIGHAETAAGVAGLLKVVAMLAHKAIPPMAKFKCLNPKIPSLETDKVAIATSLGTWDAKSRTALVNSYGAAGSNASCICSEAPSARPKARRSPSRQTYPIVISAVSKESLELYTAKLKDHLAKADPQPDLADIAFTLSERRKRYKHRLMGSCSSLGDIVPQLTPCEVSPSDKPVVYCFSGQGSDTPALNESLIKGFATFDVFIEDCDTLLTDMGFPAIKPLLSHPPPKSDIVATQTRQVVIQLAFARQWVASGLRVDAVIGHSLGELAALGFCEVLSLKDCLKLVATRARLMGEIAQEDRGGMLVVHSDESSVQDLVKKVNDQLTDCSLEMACHNSRTSYVISGHSQSIELAESMLKKQGSAKVQHLDTTHAFHSSLVKSTSKELEALQSTLKWKPSKYHLETCSKEPTDLAAYKPSDHTRQPVYFGKAIKRLQTKLGPSVWMEAGVGGPIVPLVKKALNASAEHDFVKLSMDVSVDPSSALSKTVVDLWKLGFDVQPWCFAPSESRQFEVVWLPPYQFNRSQYWLENIDHAALLAEAAQNDQPGQAEEEPEIPDRLVVPLGRPPGSDDAHDFSITTTHERYQALINGHVVQGHALCPASLYLECVGIAFNSLQDKQQEVTGVKFQDIVYSSPLTNDEERAVQLRMMPKSSSDATYSFVISSTSRSSESSRRITHCEGTISINEEDGASSSGRLLARAMQEFVKQDDLEKLSRVRAYKLFSTVVEYDEIFQGISSITLSDSEAYADIKIPENPVPTVEGTGHDARAVDCFVQVAGLLANSVEDVNHDEVLLSGGFDRIKLMATTRTEDARDWTVFVQTSPSPQKKSQTVGDIYVFSPKGDMVATFEGCRFDKVSMGRLRKMLGGIKEPQPGQSATPPARSARSQSPVNESKSSGTKQKQTSQTSTSNASVSMLSEILSSQLGVPSSQIEKMDHGATLGSLGLDSLASVEMANQLVSCEISCDGPWLQEQTIGDLKKMVADSGADITEGDSADSKFSSSPSSDEQPILTPSTSTNGDDSTAKTKLRSLLGDLLEIDSAAVSDDAELQQMGVDSLCLIELKGQLPTALSLEVEDDDVTLESSVTTILAAANISDSQPKVEPAQSTKKNSVSDEPERQPKSQNTDKDLADPARTKADIDRAIAVTDQRFDESARQNGFTAFWTDAEHALNELLIKYISDAFHSLGVDLSSIPEGDPIPTLKHLPKHSQAVNRYHLILERHSILTRVPSSKEWTRGPSPIPSRSIPDLHSAITEKHPQHQIDADLLSLTGPKLASCLSGDSNPVTLLFGTPESRTLMTDFYRDSPMLSTMTDQLLVFLKSWLSPKPSPTSARGSGSSERGFRILEIGAGTGGTTSRVAPLLENAGMRRPERYTFSDISGTLVRQAEGEFGGRYGWMDFRVFDLEKDVEPELEGEYDLVIATNCVHATRSRIGSLRKIYEALRVGGIVVLSEQTKVIDWYDVVFGLLDGWWYSSASEKEDGYPVRSPEQWREDFREAGFVDLSFTGAGGGEEEGSQRLLVSQKTQLMPIMLSGKSEYKMRTFVVKEVEGVPVHADVFLPKENTERAMPICLLVHGGGHLITSRKAIRLAQVAHLVSKGVVPVSVDYRLCPAVTLMEGPIADVRDAYVWATKTLPGLLMNKGVRVDPTRVCAGGWSTGGYLAMTLGWSLKDQDCPMPKAIVPFYPPMDFEQIALDDNVPEQLRSFKPSRSLDEALAEIPETPVTMHHGRGHTGTAAGDVRDISALHYDDPRSDLLAYLFADRHLGQSLLFYGKDHFREKHDDAELRAKVLADICPLKRLVSGDYQVPTYVVHGEDDSVAPLEATIRFIDLLNEKGVEGEVGAVPGGKHIFDMKLTSDDDEFHRYVAPAYEFLLKMTES